MTARDDAASAHAANEPTPGANDALWIPISRVSGDIPNSAYVRYNREKDIVEVKLATAPTLESRLASGNRTIDRSEIYEAADLIASGKVQPVEGVDYAKMPTAPTRETPDEPVTAERTLAAIMSNDVKALTDIIDTPPASGALAAATKRPRLTSGQRRLMQSIETASHTARPRTYYDFSSGEKRIYNKLPSKWFERMHTKSFLVGLQLTPAGRLALADATPKDGKGA